MLGDVLESAATQIAGIPAGRCQRKLVYRSHQDTLPLSNAWLIHSELCTKAEVQGVDDKKKKKNR